MLGFELETSPEESVWFEPFSLTRGDTYWLTEHAFLDSDVDDRHYVLPAVKKIRSLGNQGSVGLGEELGYLYVLVRLDNVLNFSHKPYVSSERKILILDENGTVVGGSEEAAAGTKTDLDQLKKNSSYVRYEGGKYMAAWERLENTPLSWYVVCLPPWSSVFKEANVAISICLLTSIVLLVVFLIISMHNANALSRPIQDLEGIEILVEEAVNCNAVYLPIEQDQTYGRDPFDCIRTSVENIRKMGFEKML